MSWRWDTSPKYSILIAHSVMSEEPDRSLAATISTSFERFYLPKKRLLLFNCLSQENLLSGNPVFVKAGQIRSDMMFCAILNAEQFHNFDYSFIELYFLRETLTSIFFCFTNQ